MNYEVTSKLLQALEPHLDIVKVTVPTGRKDRKSFDFVLFDRKNNVGFEVMKNEIIVFYFTGHSYFVGESYIARASVFA